MKFGTYDLPFGYEPNEFTIPRPETVIASIPTYTSVAVFNFGSILPGKKITLKWESLPSTAFDQLDALYQTGAPMTWQTALNNNKSYQITIMTLDGELLYGQDLGVRVNVEMKIIILSEV